MITLVKKLEDNIAAMEILNQKQIIVVENLSRGAKR